MSSPLTTIQGSSREIDVERKKRLVRGEGEIGGVGSYTSSPLATSM